jgi:peptide-methionine (R)-S-oxide reductase
MRDDGIFEESRKETRKESGMPEPYQTGPKSTVIETMTRRAWLIGGSSVAVLAALWWTKGPDARAGTFEVVKTDDEWRRLLKPEAYKVLRHEATERPYSSPLNGEKRPGTFACAGCDLPLFSSETKFESGTGWPSFYQPLENAVGKTEDRTFGILRTEIHCRRCGGHLGHVFDDGPKPTGLRYCMDGFALVFHPAAPSAT